MRRNALNCKRESVMNHKDFEIARKKIKTKLAHKAILKKMLETRVSRPRADKNILSSDPRLQKI
tara:strand:- start:49 stop:240 length:192 start_codon:yes stop_codon:yes gene_type:complete